MRFSENWLRTFVNPPHSSDELAHALTMAGLEVESVEPVAPPFDKVIVAEVVSVQKHPDADRLNVCQVDIGTADNKLIQVVCGAPNVEVGVKVPCALIGAHLPGIVIKQSKLRGVESFGMLCSAKELGLSENAEGLLLLPKDAPNSMNFREFYALDDQIFTLKLTPNRADCLGILGVAREVAAITAIDFVPPEIEPAKSEISDTVTVYIDKPEVCPLYCGRVIREVSLAVATPLWMAQRLERGGIRTINVVVDVLNYVMLETGQPMHAFDLAKIGSVQAGKLWVRYAKKDECLELLNGQKLELQPDMLVIANEDEPLALAGIMGGIQSGVQLETTDLFLESAFFSPEVISGKSFRLGFSSDSAHRFERGVNFAATRDALERATNLILSICGGKAGPITEVKNRLPSRDVVKVRLERIKRLLGIDVESGQISEIFERLRFSFFVNDDVFHVTPPPYRFDLVIEEDFIEEVARIYGYDHIPASLPRPMMSMLPESEVIDLPSTRLKHILISRDYREVINYAFVDANWELDFANNDSPVVLKNPIASQMSVMRSSLIGGLIANLQFNLNRKQTRVRIFEIGCCFMNNESNYQQTENIAGLCYGDAAPEQWGQPARNIDFFDVKMDLESLFWPEQVRFEKFIHPALHPGKSAQVYKNDKIAGWLGELHPRLQRKYDLPRSAILFELHIDSLSTRTLPKVKRLSKFPPVRRDIAIVVANHISTQMLLESINTEKAAIISEIHLFDVYSGKGMEFGKKSLAFRILLQDTEKTLVDKEIDEAISELIGILESKFNAKLRG
ncbi:phenylalanine--tRNA ligase subunit beta [Nitrosomonas sp. Nm33]|uniref:phenylalanine--tRNA ligase subunit beta n=1 Tax=Nitrosomonas sp. Nm33 TaxID=133724 RepID=UPI00089CD4C8|nr:phenylalanine--tRNA ligase subunit beta [Nitrosomonas sp. Nm33]SDY97694.1 phenylalanyl-tRNA synthetase beta chain [Nitrosomonas sp. Nm33]